MLLYKVHIDLIALLYKYDIIFFLYVTVFIHWQSAQLSWKYTFYRKIIIGKNGSMLKKIGTSARYEMEKFMGKKVYLETYVKVIENWKEEEKYLKEFGFENE